MEQGFPNGQSLVSWDFLGLHLCIFFFMPTGFYVHSQPRWLICKGADLTPPAQDGSLGSTWGAFLPKIGTAPHGCWTKSRGFYLPNHPFVHRVFHFKPTIHFGIPVFLETPWNTHITYPGGLSYLRTHSYHPIPIWVVTTTAVIEFLTRERISKSVWRIRISTWYNRI